MSGDADAAAALRQNRAAYARIAAIWRQRLETDYDHRFHERCRALFLAALTGDRVLDVGCGLGLDSLAFAAAGLQIVATDVVLPFLCELSGSNANLRVAAMDITAPCFKAANFDGIFACASFLHVPPGRAHPALRQLAELLRPGGILFMHHVASGLGLKTYTVEDLLVAGNPAICFCHSEMELTEMLEQAGLNVIRLSHLAPERSPSPCAVRHLLRPYQVLARKPGSSRRR